jgi:hypothetical protein
MNYCELIRKLAADPMVKMSVHLGHDMTVREMLGLKIHTADCSDCQVLLDALLEKYPPKQEFYKGELN